MFVLVCFVFVFIKLCSLVTDMISENEPLVSKFISTPREMTQLNCAAFVAGIVEGILDAAEFVRCLHNPGSYWAY